MTTVDQIENMYWDLVNAYEDVKVNGIVVVLGEDLSDNKKQVEIGTLASIELYVRRAPWLRTSSS